MSEWKLRLAGISRSWNGSISQQLPIADRTERWETEYLCAGSFDL